VEPIRFCFDPEPWDFDPGTDYLVSGIWAEIGNYAFPEERWSDFPGQILMGWLTSIRDLRLSAVGRTELHFMDGPHMVALDGRDSARWVARCITRRSRGARDVIEDCKHEGTISSDDAVEQVIQATQMMIAEFHRRGKDSDELHRLKRVYNSVLNTIT